MKKDVGFKRFKKGGVNFTFGKNASTDLIDLINEYFPPTFAEKWGKIEPIKKWIKSVTTYPEGTVSHYKARCEVHQAAVEVHRKNPHLRAPGIAMHPEISKAGGKNYSPRTVEEWIREVVKFPPGAPKKTAK